MNHLEKKINKNDNIKKSKIIKSVNTSKENIKVEFILYRVIHRKMEFLIK
jgi:hypothetical protein